MISNRTIAAIIPAFDEAPAIATVIQSLRSLQYRGLPVIDKIIVVDNNSTDATATIAKDNGAHVVFAAQRGYGSACLAGLYASDGFDVLVFVDGDNSVNPADVLVVCHPLFEGADLVIGSRTLGHRESNAMTWPQRLGNTLFCHLLNYRFNTTTTDLGPLRAISRPTLLQLNMGDRRFGWTLEMQIKSMKQRLRVKEVPVSLQTRVGQSKISGRWKGVMLAAFDLLKVFVLSR